MEKRGKEAVHFCFAGDRDGCSPPACGLQQWSKFQAECDKFAGAGSLSHLTVS